MFLKVSGSSFIYIQLILEMRFLCVEALREEGIFNALNTVQLEATIAQNDNRKNHFNGRCFVTMVLFIVFQKILIYQKAG
jgi:hypothetical protein